MKIPVCEELVSISLLAICNFLLARKYIISSTVCLATSRNILTGLKNTQKYKIFYSNIKYLLHIQVNERILIEQTIIILGLTDTMTTRCCLNVILRIKI